MSVEKLLLIRRAVFVAIGLTCVFYGAVYLLAGLSNGLNPFLPGLVGVCGAIVLFAASLISGRSITQIVFDELSRAEWRKALTFGYWLAVAMYPIFGIALWQGWVDSPQVFAVMGTLTGGVPLLYYCWLDIRG